MRSVHRGIAVGVLQCLMVLSVAGKYAWDRERLPHAWAQAAPVDPNLPIRGRYISMRLYVECASCATQFATARLSVAGDRLLATPDPAGAAHITPGNTQWLLAEPVAYFIPEHVPDPSRRPAGEELWVEVSVPAKGAPRPIRLGVKKNGILQLLGL